MPEQRANEVYRQSPGVQFQAVDDGYVFYDGDARQIIYLNLTAAAIFELCAIPLTAEAIVEGLQVNGQASANLAGVQSCLNQMTDHRLLWVEEV